MPGGGSSSGPRTDAKTQSAQWTLESAGPYKRIKNRLTGDYLHIERKLGYVDAGRLGSPEWWSAHWAVTAAFDAR